jgi:WD40 repeat protein
LEAEGIPSQFLDFEIPYLALFLWLPIVGLGALGGLVGGALVRRRWAWAGSFVAAAVGLLAALGVSLAFWGYEYVDYRNDYEERRIEQMRVEWQPISSLSASFQELPELSNLWGLQVSPDGKTMAYIADGTVKLWDLKGMVELEQIFSGYDHLISAINGFSPDGRWLITTAQENVVVWPVTGGDAQLILPGLNAAISPDQQVIVTVEEDVGFVFDMETSQQIDQFPLIGYWGDLARCLAFSPDGKLLAECEGKFVQLWYTDSWEPAGQLNLPYSPDLGVWIHSLVFSPDGRLAAAATPDGPFLWDVMDRERLGGTQIVVSDESEIGFSPDGTLVVSAGQGDGAIYLWDAMSRQPVGKLASPDASVVSVTFLSDSQLFARYWRSEDLWIGLFEGKAPQSGGQGIWTLDTP